MSVIARLTLDGVADGALTAASAGPGDTAPDNVTGALTVATDAAVNGKAVVYPGTAPANYEWQYGVDFGESSGRIKFKHPGVLGSSWSLILAAPTGGGFGWKINVSGPGKLRVINNANATVGADGAITMTGGTWYYAVWKQTSTTFHLELRAANWTLLDTLDRTSTFGPMGVQKIGTTTATPVATNLRTAELITYDEVLDVGPWEAWSPEPILHGALIEYPRRSSVSVGAIVEATTDVQLVVSLNSDLSSPVTSAAVAPSTDGWVNVRQAGLEPDTEYYLGLLLDGTDPGWRGIASTRPLINGPRSYSVLFGSCQNTGSNHVVFDRMSSEGAEFFAHLGDFGYPDTTDETTWRGAYEQTLGADKVQSLLSHTPFRYTPDNHDWGGEFSDASSPVSAFIPGAIREIAPTGLVDGAGLWSSWVLGRVRYIMLDTRSQRDAYNAVDGPTKTMLGSSQKAWLKFMLQHAAEPVIVIFCSIIWTPGGGADRWASYPNEFSELTTFVTGLPNVQAKIYVGGGDAHLVAAHDGAGDLMAVPRVAGAAFNSGGSVSPETWNHGQHGNDSGRGQYGLLEVVDAGTGTIEVNFRGKQDDGVVLVQMDTEFPVVAPPVIYSWAGKGLANGATVTNATAGPGDSPIAAVNGTAPTIGTWDDRGTWITFPDDVSSYVVLATYDDAMPTQTWSFHFRVPVAGASRILTAWDGTRSAVAYVVDCDASGVVSVSTGAGAFLDAVGAPVTFGEIYRIEVMLDHGDISVLVYEEASPTPIGFATGLLAQEFTPNELWVGPTFAFEHPILQVGQFRRTNAAQALGPLPSGAGGNPGGVWVGSSPVPGGTPLSEVVGWSR